MSYSDIYDKLMKYLAANIYESRAAKAFYNLVVSEIVKNCDSVLFSRFLFIPESNSIWITINVFWGNNQNYMIELWGDYEEISRGQIEFKQLQHYKPTDSRMHGRQKMLELEGKIFARYENVKTLFDGFVLENEFSGPPKTLADYGYSIF